jgi:hypothetical protein
VELCGLNKKPQSVKRAKSFGHAFAETFYYGKLFSEIFLIK